MQNKITPIIIGIVLLLAILFVSMKIINQDKVSDSLSFKENFVLNSVNGTSFNLKTDRKKIWIEGMENKIVFLKVFGWDCNFCKREIPQLIALQESLKEKFSVLAIEAQEHSVEDSRAKIKEYGINYPIIIGQEQKRFYKYLQEQYGWTGIIPLTIVISTKGDVLAFELGEKSYSLSELFKASLKNN